MGERTDFGGVSVEGSCESGIRITLLVTTLHLTKYTNSRNLLMKILIPRHIHRADLHRGLLEAATELGCKVYLDSRVVSIDAYMPSITTAGGKTYKGDLIVASDGLHSMAREIVMGKPGPPVPTGQMVYRVTLPVETLKGIPELEEIITVPRNNHWLGPNGTVLSYLLEGVNDTLINFVFTCDVEGWMPDGVDQRPGNLETVRKRFSDWDPR